MNLLKNDPLFLNYLKFMALFRGKVRIDTDSANVSSEKKEFTFSIPYTNDNWPETSMLLLSEQLDITSDHKWKPAGQLCFMTRTSAGPQKTPSLPSCFQLESGISSELIEKYSIAQSAGFLETPDLHSAWSEWLTNCNRKTSKHEDVTYYVISNQNTPIAGAFIVESNNCVGIYGVTTSSQYRKQGLATVLLNKILTDFSATPIIGLQVEAGSYAHNYYQGLSFKESYQLKRYIRQESKNEN